MSTQPMNSQDFVNPQTQAEMDLLAGIVQSDSLYPWNPLPLETDDYFAALETDFDLSQCLNESEISQKSQALFERLSQIWSAVDLQTSLCQKFAEIPQEFLTKIAQVAQTAIANGQALGDQMVQCVQAVLPQWPEEDLQVLARPLAFSMRQAESDPLELNLMAGRSWEELSDIEQARAGLAIARYAISQLAENSSP